MVPEPGDGGCLVVVEFGKAVAEEFVGKNACLGETVYATVHLKVDPGVVGKLIELVLIKEFLGDVCKLDTNVLWPVKQGVKIEVLEVHGGKPGITLGENTVDENLTSSIEPVEVPTSPGYMMLLPPMVMSVWSALSPFSGWTLQTTLE